MREITAPTALLSPSGHLIESAVGFSRRPLHTTDHLPRGLWHGLRTKCWDRWVVVTPDVIVGLTVADLDLGAMVRLFTLDRSTGHEIDQSAVRLPTPRDAVDVPTSLPPFFARGSLGDLSVRFDAAGQDRTVLRAETERVSLVVEVDARGESLSTVVPLAKERFRYSVTAPGLPATGLVVLDGVDLPVDRGWAALQRTRGRFPRRTRHLWAAGAGLQRDGTRLALALSGPDELPSGPGRPSSMPVQPSSASFQASSAPGTEDTATENALLVDGRLDGPRPAVTWSSPEDPDGVWQVDGSWIQATLRPWHVRRAAASGGLVHERTLQVFGTWSGRADLVDGTTVSLDGLTGWVERSDRRW